MENLSSNKVNSTHYIQEAYAECFVVHILKGVSSKPSGKLIKSVQLMVRLHIFPMFSFLAKCCAETDFSCPDILFLKLETSNFGYLLFFPLTVQGFSKIGQHWYYLEILQGLMFLDFVIYQKFKRGRDPYRNESSQLLWTI